jgi:ABC-2 type transport system ATP-binding protein
VLNTIIKISDLQKSYENIDAVKGISFEVNEGEMFGLVGPDGAGKTTTIRIICGLLGIDSGSVEMFGKDLSSNKSLVQKSIGYLSQKYSIYGDLSIDENIEFFAEIHNVRNYKVRRDDLLKFTRLTNFRDRLADQLSGGMKQKLALACALIHKPKILFLDEPTTGVDPVSRRDFWKILSNLQKDGITILLTTPYLDEAERCNRVAMMDKGKFIALDTPSHIKQSINKEVIEIVCSPVKDAFSVIHSETEFEAQMFGDRIDVVVNNAVEDYKKLETVLTDGGIKINSYRTITPSLENVFMHKIKEAS